MSNCEKCDAYEETTEEHTILGIPCDLCRSCFRYWARRYHKNPDTTRFEVLTERMNLLKASSLGRPLNSFDTMDILVEEREAIELKLLEDTIDWLEEPLR